MKEGAVSSPAQVDAAHSLVASGGLGAGLGSRRDGTETARERFAPGQPAAVSHQSRSAKEPTGHLSEELVMTPSDTCMLSVPSHWRWPTLTPVDLGRVRIE